MDVDFDVVVVGGSANGSQVARVIAEHGLRVLVVEEHERAGFPEHCSGLFTIHGLELIDSLPPKRLVLNNMVYGARLYAPNAMSVTVKKREPHAIVVDRARFDEFLLDDARKKGAEVWLGARALVPRQVKDVWRLSVRRGRMIEEVRTKVIVSTDGWRGRFSRLLGFPQHDKNHVVNAAQYYMKGIEGLDRRLVEVFQTHEYAPGYFAWIIPISDTSAKVGLGTTRMHAGKELQRLIREHPVFQERFRDVEVFYRTAGQIVFTGPLGRSFRDGAVVVGDAAGQIKPTTGGGVILGGLAARIAGNVVAKAIHKGDWSSRVLREYESRWKRELWWNLWLMKRVRKYLNKLSDEEVNALFEVIEKPEIKRVIEDAGDVDDQQRVVKLLLRIPGLWRFYVRTFPKLVYSLF